MGLKEARRNLRDAESATYASHPAEYLFKDAGTRMSQTWTWDDLVAMMDQYGIVCAQIGVDSRSPESAIELFDRFPGRFFGEVGVDPNQGMEAVRALERTVQAHPAIRAASLAPCLLYPQVPIGDKRCYPIYAKCIELQIPINVLTGVPGPRVPMACQDPYQLDELCWFFPELTIVMRQRAEPWVDLAVKRSQVAEPLLLDHRVRSRALPEGDHRLCQHPQRRQGDVVGLLPRPVVRTGLRRARRASCATRELFLGGCNARRVFGLDDLIGTPRPLGEALAKARHWAAGNAGDRRSGPECTRGRRRRRGALDACRDRRLVTHTTRASTRRSLPPSARSSSVKP